MSVFYGNNPRRNVELWPEDRVPTNNLERLIASANPYIKKERDEAERLRAEVDARCRAEGGDGAPESGDVSADRAQQGEPVDEEQMREAVSDFRKAAYEFGKHHEPDDHGRMMEAQLRIFTTFRAATKASAPADAPKDHEIREAINQLRDVAVKFHAAQQLRERIAGIVLPLVKRAAPVPDTGIPTSGAVENWNKAIALLEEVCGPKVAAWWTLERRTRAFLDEVGAAPAHPGEGEKACN